MPVALLATWTPSLASPSSPLSVTLQSALKLSQWCACVSSSRMTLKGQIVHVPLFICPQGTGVLTCLSCKQRKLYIPVKEKKKNALSYTVLVCLIKCHADSDYAAAAGWFHGCILKISVMAEWSSLYCFCCHPDDNAWSLVQLLSLCYFMCSFFFLCCKIESSNWIITWTWYVFPVQCVWGVEGKWDIKGCQTSHMLDTPKQWPTSLNEFNYVSVRSRVTVRPVGRCVHLRQVCTVRHPVGELSCPFCPLRDVLLTSLAPLSSAQLAARGTTTQPDTLQRNYHRLLLVKSGFPNVCLFGVRSWRRWFWLIETVAERLFFCLSFFGVSNLWRVQKKKKKDLLKAGIYLWWRLNGIVAWPRRRRFLQLSRRIEKNKTKNKPPKFFVTKGEGQGSTCCKKRQVSHFLEGEFNFRVV